MAEAGLARGLQPSVDAGFVSRHRVKLGVFDE